MIPTNIWDIQLPLRSLYSLCIEPLCQSRGLTRTELDILMFLANNPKYDTAAEICSVRHLAKSHVSISLKSLARSGYITASPEAGDRRRIHLKLTEKAEPIVQEGRRRQGEFVEILLEGFDGEERKRFHVYIARLERNIKRSLEERSK